MPVDASRTRAAYLAYLALALLFAIAVTNRIRDAVDRFDELLHGVERARTPFDLVDADLSASYLQPEARAAGLKDGDVISSIGSRAIRGSTDYYSLLRKARPGGRLSVGIQSSGSSRRDISIELRPFFPAGPKISDWFSFGILELAIPFFCLALGFWVVAVRIRDKRAWLLLLLMLSFPEFAYSQFGTLYGRDDLAEAIFGAYHQLFTAIWPTALVLLAIYFPERLDIDRRIPWAKWLVVGPSLFKVFLAATVVTLLRHHAAGARDLLRMLALPDKFSLLWLAAIEVVLFFAILAYKTLTALNRDARRRLLLLDAATALSLAPVIVWLTLREAFGIAVSDWFQFLALALLLLFPLTMAYAIVVHRAMEVSVVIRQGLQYLLAKGGVRVFQVAVSIAIIVLAATMSAGRNSVLARVLLISAGFGLLAFTRIFAERVRRWLDRRFFREAYNAEQILGDLANRVRTMVETRPLLETVARSISQSLHVPQVSLLLNGGQGFQVAYPDSNGVEIPQDGLAVRHLQKDQHLLVDWSDSASWVRNAGIAERNSLEKLQSELLLPLSPNRKLIGIMSLGPKQSEEPFTSSDIRLLDSVATQTGLALENSRLTAEIAAEVAQRERMNRELEIAREVQQRLFPQIVPVIPGIELAGFCRPALGIGGDYYDYFALPDGGLGIAVGDVSGKGIPAALLMASLRASLRAQTMRTGTDLAALMENVNTLGYEGSTVSKYATFFYGQYSPQSRVLHYVNAGHEPPLVFRAGDLIPLETGGPVVGLLPGARYEQGSISLLPGDVLVAFTDGISEAMNPAAKEWGVENLVSCVRASNGISAQCLIDRIMTSADAFAAGAQQHDD
ncbi:MAG TPA: SpoIIE family protein phosphatase, partial [Bryobacteraceae bacterium]